MTSDFKRRAFLGGGLAAGAALASSSGFGSALPARRADKIKVGVIGCGSVSNMYLPHLAKSPTPRS